jgi:hypothetical protein
MTCQAASAAECANEQGRFCPSDILFANWAAKTRAHSMTRLKEMAAG